MRLARGYLATARGRASVSLAMVAVAAADSVLSVAVTAPPGPDVGSIVIAVFTLVTAEVAIVVGAMGALRGRRREIGTLRALGWPAPRVQLRLMRSFAALGALVGAGALPLAWAAQALLAGTWTVSSAQAGWRVAGAAGGIAMVVVGSWGPVRAATGDGAALGGAALGGVSPDGAAPGGVVARKLLAGTAIAGAGMALSLQLAVHWAWLRHPVPWQVIVADWAAVAAILVLATGTVGDLGWPAARQRAGESRTLRAMGWPARGLAWAVTADALLLGAAGGIVAGVLDVAGSLAVADRMPQRMLAVVAITVAAGAGISLTAAGASALVQRGRMPRWRRDKPDTPPESHCSPVVSLQVAYRDDHNG